MPGASHLIGERQEPSVRQAPKDDLFPGAHRLRHCFAFSSLTPIAPLYEGRQDERNFAPSGAESLAPWGFTCESTCLTVRSGPRVRRNGDWMGMYGPAVLAAFTDFVLVVGLVVADLLFILALLVRVRRRSLERRRAPRFRNALSPERRVGLERF